MKHTSRWKSFVPRSNRHRCTNDNNEFGKVWRWFSRNSNTFSWVSLCSHHARIDYATVVSIWQLGPNINVVNTWQQCSTAQPSALTVLVGRQEGHVACKKLGVGLLVDMIWLELCRLIAPTVNTTSIILSSNKNNPEWRHAGNGQPRSHLENGL